MINNGLPLAHSLRNKCHLPSTHLPPETGRESMCAFSDADVGDDAKFSCDGNARECGNYDCGTSLSSRKEELCLKTIFDCLPYVKFDR